MSQVELEQPLQEGALREIERSLYGKLKAHRLPDSFIERCGEDAIQKGFLEYLRAREKGAEIDNRNAFVVRAAFCRAIDELRHEAHQADGVAVDSLIEGGRRAEPSSEELAVERLEAEELREAIASLPAEERQILVLHYFEELSDRRGAELLYCSERNYRRRLKRALADVGRRLGVPVPEPGSELAIEVGLAAWTTLGGAQVALAHGPLDQLIGMVDRGRDGLEWLGARLRDPVARLSASGTDERVSAIASGPAGKLVGGCAGAVVVCLLGGVVGPGVGGPASSLLGDQHPPAAKHRTANTSTAPVPTRPQSFVAAQAPAGAASAAQSTGASRAQRKRIARRSEQRQLAEQASGLTRVEKESSSYSAPTEASTATAESESATTAPSSGGSEASAGEEAQTQQQFGAFK